MEIGNGININLMITISKNSTEDDFFIHLGSICPEDYDGDVSTGTSRTN
jgi:hypothetical protein